MKKKDFKYYGMALVIVIGAALFGFYGVPRTQGRQIPSKSPPIIFPEIATPTYFDFTKPPPIVQIQKTDLATLIQTKQPKLDPSTAKEIALAVEKYSKKFSFPPELIICLIERESSFHKKAFSKPTPNSKLGCMGLMQINPVAHLKKLKKLNIKSDEIYHIDSNVHIGTMILKEYYDKTKTISGALKKYLGVNSKSYMLAILVNFTDLMIKQK